MYLLCVCVVRPALNPAYGLITVLMHYALFSNGRFGILPLRQDFFFWGSGRFGFSALQKRVAVGRKSHLRYVKRPFVA